MDSGGRSSLQTNEEDHRRTPNANTPKEKDELIIYLAAAKEAISAVLMTDREGKQVPVYFVSRALRGPRSLYSHRKSRCLALLSASKRLKRYFQAHTIVVITDQPIKQLLSSSEISERMLKWKFELEGYDIQYRPRTAIKGQIIADFIVNDQRNLAKESGMDPIFEQSKRRTQGSFREIFTSSNTSERKQRKQTSLSKIASEKLYTSQQTGTCGRTKEEVPKTKGILAVVEEEGNTWMTPICEYLTKEILSADKKKARAVRRKAAMYTMINGTLYKKSFLGPWLRCVNTAPSNYSLDKYMKGRAACIPGNCIRQWKHFATTHSKTGAKNYISVNALPSVKHPQTNGLVERANRSLGEGIKARLDERSKDWIGELSHVLWSHRTMIKSSNGETPFSLTYGTEACQSLAEIGMPNAPGLWKRPTKNL
ncbi:reverse transcriptase domain-containing protein [Tanacetum coccineum]